MHETDDYQPDRDELGLQMAYHHGNLRVALIDAALEIIEEKGVDAVSLREVAKRAGVSVSAPFRHYESKTALLTAVVENTMQRLVASTEAAQHQAAADDPLAQLEALAVGFIRWVHENPEHYKLFATLRFQDYKDTEHAFAIYSNFLNRLKTLLEEAARQGHVAAGVDSEAMLLTLRTFLFGLPRMLTWGHLTTSSATRTPLQMLELTIQEYIRLVRAPAATPVEAPDPPDQT